MGVVDGDGDGQWPRWGGVAGGVSKTTTTDADGDAVAVAGDPPR